MAPNTQSTNGNGKNKNNNNNAAASSASSAADQKELFVRCINEIVAQLVIAQQQGKDVNLNRLKCDIASKHGLKTQPKLVDIISAVPAQFKVHNTLEQQQTL
jgi:hypothetical protein